MHTFSSVDLQRCHASAPLFLLPMGQNVQSFHDPPDPACYGTQSAIGETFSGISFVYVWVTPSLPAAPFSKRILQPFPQHASLHTLRCYACLPSTTPRSPALPLFQFCTMSLSLRRLATSWFSASLFLFRSSPFLSILPPLNR